MVPVVSSKESSGVMFWMKRARDQDWHLTWPWGPFSVDLGWLNSLVVEFDWGSRWVEDRTMVDIAY